MPYETQSAELAKCAMAHHGALQRVDFLSGNKDYVLLFQDGTELRPSDDACLRREYAAYPGYYAIAQELGGTHPFSLLTFGYQGTGPGCFTSFLKAAGFDVEESDLVGIETPVRMHRDGSLLAGRPSPGGGVMFAEPAPEPAEANDAGPDTAARQPASTEPVATTTPAAATPAPATETPAPATTAPPAAWYEDPAHVHQYRYWNGSAWTDDVADNGVAAKDPLAPPKPPERVHFDENGRFTGVELPASTGFYLERKGVYSYFTKKVGTLLEATEHLREVGSVPKLTYYTVETPDGNLGRDINGLYTEAPIKTAGLHLLVDGPLPADTGFASLTGFGDEIANESTVANMRQQGQYANFVLLMECGRCGYRSPVETQAGSMTRQCYACGAVNSGTRGTIQIVGGDGRMVEI